MRKVFILHLLPLEYYPPVTNLLDVLEHREDVKTQVYSTHNTKQRQIYSSPNISIFRSAYPAYAKNKLSKLLAYISFLIKPLWHLIKWRPDAILYFEPHSALPAYLYKRFLYKNVKLCIHHHEYYAPEDFQEPSMMSVRFFHSLERKYLFKQAQWISQTNKQRLKLFQADNPSIDQDILHILANYPPTRWQHVQNQLQPDQKLQLLYIGALSFENTYIKELVDFVNSHPNTLQLSIYGYNVSNDVVLFLEKQNKDLIRFYKSGIDYNQIPTIASAFDVGLILYKGHNLNYIYNAPNKLFEYLACGLNVWLPQEMKACQPYLNEKTRPTVKVLNFKQLKPSLITDYYKSVNLPIKKTEFNCENELQMLIHALTIKT